MLQSIPRCPLPFTGRVFFAASAQLSILQQKTCRNLQEQLISAADLTLEGRFFVEKTCFLNLHQLIVFSVLLCGGWLLVLRDLSPFRHRRLNQQDLVAYIFPISTYLSFEIDLMKDDISRRPIEANCPLMEA